MARTRGGPRQRSPSSTSSGEEEQRTPSPPPLRRRPRRSTAREPPPPEYDAIRFTSKENQEWYEAREHKGFIFEMHVAPDVNAEFKLTEAFDILGWGPILTLPDHYYPQLVKEFYANVVNKSGHSGENIRSYVRGRRIEVERSTLAQLLGVRNTGPAVDLKKEFHAPDRHWEMGHAMARFQIEQEFTRSQQKATVKANKLDARLRLITYLFAHNVIPKKSSLNEVRKSDLYFLDKMFHDRTSSFANIPLPNIIICYMRTAARHATTAYRFGFPRLLSFLFERMEVNLDGVEQRPVKSTYELNYFVLNDLSISTANIPHPRARQSQPTSQFEVGGTSGTAHEEAEGVGTSTAIPHTGPSTSAPPRQRTIWERVLAAIGCLETRVNEGFNQVNTRLDTMESRIHRIEDHLHIPGGGEQAQGGHGDDQGGGDGQP